MRSPITSSDNSKSAAILGSWTRKLSRQSRLRGWEMVHEYRDAGISGSKGRDARPGLDEMLKDAQRRCFDVVMAWAIDRLGRSLIDLLGTIQTLEACHAVFAYQIKSYRYWQDQLKRTDFVALERADHTIQHRCSPPWPSKSP
jgi:hypothetical protein